MEEAMEESRMGSSCPAAAKYWESGIRRREAVAAEPQPFLLRLRQAMLLPAAVHRRWTCTPRSQAIRNSRTRSLRRPNTLISRYLSTGCKRMVSQIQLKRGFHKQARLDLVLFLVQMDKQFQTCGTKVVRLVDLLDDPKSRSKSEGVLIKYRRGLPLFVAEETTVQPILKWIKEQK